MITAATKLAAFKERCTLYGSTVTVNPFSSWPAGVYVDGVWGVPDIHHASYPAVTPPDASFGAAVTVSGFVYHPRLGEHFLMTPWGQEIQVRKMAIVPGDTAIAHLDRIVHDGDTHYVFKIQAYELEDIPIVIELSLVERIPIRE